MSFARAPRAALRPFIKQLWISDGRDAVAGARREHVLPTGAMHVVLRLDDEPVRLWNERGQDLTFGTAVVGGMRSTYYVKELRPARTVGAQLHPAASLPLLGVPADELGERHTRLEDLWDAQAAALRTRLLEARSPADALARFEATLESRLPRARGVHPGIAHALVRFDALGEVTDVVRETGLSHRRFLTLFRRTVGIAPKRYCRVLRFQRALHGVLAGQALSSVAAEAGYSDQAHLTREFRELAGISPGTYREVSPEWEHHVPVGEGSNSFKTNARPSPKIRP